MSAVKPVEAFRWTCADCHDTGLESTMTGALTAHDEHRDDYHAPAPYIDPMTWDELEADDPDPGLPVTLWSRTGE